MYLYLYIRVYMCMYGCVYVYVSAFAQQVPGNCAKDKLEGLSLGLTDCCHGSNEGKKGAQLSRHRRPEQLERTLHKREGGRT